MNTTRKIIISIFGPILISFPILNINIKKNISSSESSDGMSTLTTWENDPLYNHPSAWYICILISAIALFILWKTPGSDQKREKTKS